MKSDNHIGARQRQYFEKADFLMPELFLKELWAKVGKVNCDRYRQLCSQAIDLFNTRPVIPP